ncbi:MAG: type II toxin-antitoxin system VapC family toxin [Terracidiphilus sp.]
MKRIFADTGYWIALLMPQDALHEEAHRLFATLAGVEIVTSDWVLIELLNGFSARGPYLRSLVSNAVSALKTNPRVTVEPQVSETFADAFQLYRDRLDKDWSMTDCSSVLIMRRYGIDSALTHDKHFEQAGFNALLM